MIRYTLAKIFYSLSRVPFWKPWGFWRWLMRALFFLLLLITFIFLLCLPVRENNTEGEVVEQTEDGQFVHTGDVQVTLRWETSDDLDLHVTDPFFSEISYSNRYSLSGGELDVDANVTSDNLMQHPIENIYWPSGGAPRGLYKVDVVLYSHRTAQPVHYWVTVKNGDSVNTYEGELGVARDRLRVVKFRHGSTWFGTH